MTISAGEVLRADEVCVERDDERLDLWEGQIFDMTSIQRQHAHGVRHLNTVLSGYGDVHCHEDGMLMTMGVPVEIAALF